jgi:hypothetical protein
MFQKPNFFKQTIILKSSLKLQFSIQLVIVLILCTVCLNFLFYIEEKGKKVRAGTKVFDKLELLEPHKIESTPQHR